MARRTSLESEREDFIKSQLIALQKALNKTETALKQKHVRVLIVGTHKEKAANVFWNSVNRIQLEKNPILSWKFCHILHKLMRDGHQRVISDSTKYRSRISDLGKFWHHLRDGYGKLICVYCKMLVNRLTFHQNNPVFPGSLQLSDNQLNSLGGGDVNNAFELAIEILDLVDDLLALQRDVFNSLDMSRANSLTASGQCRLAPVILVVLDTSKFYDYLVKMIFRLHATLPPDTLTGHRDRFNGQFKQIKQFYYTSSNLQYFKYLVSVPTLPDSPPNFLEASDFDSYVTPHAYLHGDTISEGSDTPPDSQSLVDMPLIDIADEPVPDPLLQTPRDTSQQINNGIDNEKDQLINSLRHDVEDSRAAYERLKSEARSRIDQYENRLLQMEHENGQCRQLVDQLSEENERFRGQTEELQNEKNQGLLHKAQSSEDKFVKMKEVYGNLRQEHIEVLKKMTGLQKELETVKGVEMDSQERVRSIEREIECVKRERCLVEEKAQNSAQTMDDLNGQLAKMQMEIEHINKDHEQVQAETEQKQMQLRAERDAAASELERLTESCHERLNDLFEACCEVAVHLIDDTLEQFENPAHLSVTCSPEFMLTRTGPLLETFEQFNSCFDEILNNDNKQIQTVDKRQLIKAMLYFGHTLCEVVLHGKATAHAAPTDQTEGLVAVCRSLAVNAKELFGKLGTRKEDFCTDWRQIDEKHLFAELRKRVEEMEKLFRSLLGKMGDVDVNELGSEIEREMTRMDGAIQKAAAKIQEMMSKSRETDTGIRLEVNEKILDSCNQLMQAIMLLVARSRDMQREIVAGGRGGGSVQDFYKRNHQWTEGLLSAAKAVGVAANVLVHAADSVVTGEGGKFEELIVASREIAASTATLFVSSRVKADRDSETFAKLATASKQVNTATAQVLGTVKAGQQTLTDDDALDFSHLSLHQAKKMEMESQVRMLELETALTRERSRLGELRKTHYHLAAEEQSGASREGTPN